MLISFYIFFPIKTHAFYLIKHVLDDFIRVLVDPVQLFDSLLAGKCRRMWAIAQNVHPEVCVRILVFHFVCNDLF